jgi:histidinol phosphatase-like PHP family hydrolase
MNLNPLGEGDLDPTALHSLDLVLGSFHSALRRKNDQTERYLAAIRNPNIQILGHPRRPEKLIGKIRISSAFHRRPGAVGRSATAAAAIDNDKAVKRRSREVSAILNDLN